MVLSWSLGFVFIKGRKVAGTSVECVLSEVCSDSDIVTPITPRDEAFRVARGSGARNYSADAEGEEAYRRAVATSSGAALAAVRPPERLYYHHMPLGEVARIAGPAVLELPVLCVERHPYAKVLSWVNHQLTWRAYARGGEMRGRRERIRAALEEGIATQDILSVRNIDLYRRPSGEVTARVLRFEHLHTDVQAMLGELGVPFDGLPHLKRGIEARPHDLRGLVTEEGRAAIDELFAEEFDRFGYEPL